MERAKLWDFAHIHNSTLTGKWLFCSESRKRLELAAAGQGLVKASEFVTPLSRWVRDSKLLDAVMVLRVVPSVDCHLVSVARAVGHTLQDIRHSCWQPDGRGKGTPLRERERARDW